MPYPPIPPLSQGFTSEAERNSLIALVDTSTPEKARALQHWRTHDRTKAGLTRLPITIPAVVPHATHHYHHCTTCGLAYECSKGARCEQPDRAGTCGPHCPGHEVAKL